jgi:two-component system, sensor histidine kinase and response regulator
MNTPPAIRVLIAEDDAMVSEMIKRTLEKLDYVVVGEAADGRQAIELTQSLAPDVILMDIQMPELNGIEVTRQIQERCPTPVVILSAYETSHLLNQASAAGVGAYLVKPPNPGEIERGITIAMARFDDMIELRRLNDDLNAYAHTVAHDLENPLTLILSPAELLALEHTTMSPAEIWQCAQSIARGACKMQHIIDSLLLLAETRTAEITLEPLDMAAIVSEALQRLTWLIDKYQAQFILPETWIANPSLRALAAKHDVQTRAAPGADPTSCTGLGYAAWVEEVWANYISNALKYGGKLPRIELGATPQKDGMIRFWVRDGGPGIAPEQQIHLFKPFTWLPNDQVKGHGLGLSIVRRIVEKLGGQVGIESEGIPGRGSEFWFTLRQAQ